MTSKEKGIFNLKAYNSNPNLCKFCGKPIYAPHNKKLRETTIKKFCSKSCAAKYNNKGNIKNIYGTNGVTSKTDTFTDEEILKMFIDSKSISEFSKKLGYKHKITANQSGVNDRLKNLNLDINDIKRLQNHVVHLKKEELFNKSSCWQNARSTIARMARKAYADSDKPKSCIVCGYKNHYEVAHIKAVSEFPKDSLLSEINNVDNLIALCPNHHWEYDNMKLDISQYLNIN